MWIVYCRFGLKTTKIQKSGYNIVISVENNKNYNKISVLTKLVSKSNLSHGRILWKVSKMSRYIYSCKFDLKTTKMKKTRGYTTVNLVEKLKNYKKLVFFVNIVSKWHYSHGHVPRKINKMSGYTTVNLAWQWQK